VLALKAECAPQRGVLAETRRVERRGSSVAGGERLQKLLQGGDPVLMGLDLIVEQGGRCAGGAIRCSWVSI
jgi:hypothetical protein